MSKKANTGYDIEEIMKMLDELRELYRDAESNIFKWANRGVKSAGMRASRTLMHLRDHAHKMRMWMLNALRQQP